MGGRVALEGKRTPLTTVDQLPAGEYRVEVVDWVGVNAEPTDLERLSGLKALRELRLPGPIWSRNADGGKDLSRELKALAPLKSLRKLTFSDHFLDKIRFRDAGLAEIQDLTNLETLAIRQADITGKTLKPFVRLETLDVTLCPVTDEGFASIAAMKDLRRLWARDTLITGAALTNLAALDHLEDLDLQGTRIGDEGVAHLARLKNLRKLNLQSTDVTDASMTALAGLTNLEVLNLYRTRVSNSGAADLKTLKALRTLDLRYTRASSAGLEGLRAALPDARISASDSSRQSIVAPKHLASEADLAVWIEKSGGRAELLDGHVVAVSLRGTSLSESAIVALSKLPALESLDLSGTDLSDESAAELRKAPRLRVLHLGNTFVEGLMFKGWRDSKLEELTLLGCPVDDEGMRPIATLSHLKTLSLAETDVTNVGLAALGRLTKLESLDLSGTDASDPGLSVLENLTNLRRLSLRDTRLTDAALPHLAVLTHLEELNLGRTRVTGKGLWHLRKLDHLKRLSLDYVELDDEGFAALPNLKSLERLNLDSTNVTDKSVAVLKSFDKLRFLDIYHSLLTESGVASLKSSLPQCQFRWDKDARVLTRRRA